MPKKIGRDVLDKKGGAILSGKDAEDFERFQEEQLDKEEEREEKPKSEVELKSKMPDEKEPSADELARERAEIQEDMAKAKALGKLKVQKIVLKGAEEE
jgi:hypothetical protein